jgi:arylsulfatase A-like enzyme
MHPLPHPKPAGLQRRTMMKERMIQRERLLVLLLVAATACGPATFAPPPTGPAPAPLRGNITDHVLIVSMDGLRPDAIPRFRPRSLSRLVCEGSYSLEAQTIVPSRTLPGHMSMVSGEPPEVHGVLHNNDPDESRWEVDVPTIFALAHEHGLTTAGIFSKTKFRQLYEPGTLDHADQPANYLDLRPAWRTVDEAQFALKRIRPNLLFVHFAEPDYIGHFLGWMGRPYRWSVTWTDRAVAQLLRTADQVYGPANYTVILTSDHGGSGLTHGSADPVDTSIPWVAWGRGVRGETMLGAGIRTMDTAATAMWLLGVERPEEWLGRPVTEAFFSDETLGSRYPPSSTAAGGGPTPPAIHSVTFHPYTDDALVRQRLGCERPTGSWTTGPAGDRF